jgi:hypothetical protein
VPRGREGETPGPHTITPRSLPKPQNPCNTVLNLLSFHEWMLRDLTNAGHAGRSLC